MRDHSNEIWRNVKGYEGLYRVSNFGRVLSLFRKYPVMNRWGTITHRSHRERILKPHNGAGRFTVWFHKGIGRHCFAVHILVLEAFVSERPNGLEGCHNDGNYKNNHAANLRWDTHKGNQQDRIRHGTNNGGEKNGSAKLTRDDVINLRKLYATGKYLMKDLAVKYNMTPTGLRPVIRGLLWKNVKYLPKSDFGRGPNRLIHLERIRKF